MSDDRTIEQIACDLVAKTEAQWAADRTAARAAEQKQVEADRAAWHGAIAPTAVACGVRQSLIDGVVVQAAAVFDLKDGKLVAKVTNPRDPCSDYTLVDYFADLHATDDNFLWEKKS